MVCPKCGMVIPLDRGESRFDGTLLQLLGWQLLGVLVTLLTAGIMYPWAACWIIAWETKHTVINGKRLRFDGTPLQLFGNWIKWWLLSLVTLGIYAFWLPIKVKQWLTKHTVIDEGEAVAAPDVPAPAESAPAVPESAPVAAARVRVSPDIPDERGGGGAAIAVLLALACVSLVAELAALISNLWLTESAFAVLFPAWSVYAALGGAVVFGVAALAVSDRS